MNLLKFNTLLVWFVSVIIIATAQHPTVNLTNYGTFIGSTNTTASGRVINQFLSIKYAESPTGPNRFKAPIKAAPSAETATHNVQNYGRSCPTIAILLNMTDSDGSIDVEDCLHVSVYSTNLTARNPVMVFIHGGAFTDGSAEPYKPHFLLEKDIVLVVPQYRLGPLGFLSTQTADIPGNAAVSDLILALEWVQTNIAQFGGDPSQVTVFGQSAGAALIGGLLLSPIVTQNHFQKAILQSGAALNNWAFDYNPVDNTRDIAVRAGCYSTETIEAINHCFMNMGALRMLQAFWLHSAFQDPRIPTGGNKMTFGPSSPVFPQSPEFLIENIAEKNIPILGGTTKHDGTFVLATIYVGLMEQGILNRTTTFSEIFGNFKNLMSLQERSGTMSAYLMDTLFTKEQVERGNFTELLDGLTDLCTITGFKAPILQTLQANLNSSSFLYTFDYEGEYTMFGLGGNTSHYPFRGGVHHADELIYMFPFAGNFNDNDRRVSERMIDLWTSFANNSVPSATDCGNWPTFSTPFGPYMHLNRNCLVAQNFIDEFDVAVRERYNSFGTRLMGVSSVFIVISIFVSFLFN